MEVSESRKAGVAVRPTSGEPVEPISVESMGNHKKNGSSSRWMSVADPIHGLIRFDREDPAQQMLLGVMNSQSFQRLRRIRQMGLAEFVFPGATHSRFAHSIGAAHLMTQTVEHLARTPQGKALLESPYEDSGIPLRHLLLLGILIHDIGHSPLSHTLEDVLDLKAQGLMHDPYWNRKILLEDEDIRKVWKRFNPKLPEAVLNFMGDGAPKHFLAQLISSQLDMDRLDYLQRDSHFLGVQYGRVEAARIISNLEIARLPDGREGVVVREEAVPAIEHYLFGRHQAYKMALHSLDKASEALLKKTLQRFRWAREQNIETGEPARELYRLITDGHRLSTVEYLRMDDCYLWNAINQWAAYSEDSLLRDLANRMLRHNLLKFVDLSKYGVEGGSIRTLASVYETLSAHYEKRRLPMDFCFDETLVPGKPMYQPPDAREPILILTGRGKVVDLREVSSFSLSEKTNANVKHLVFIWDREALNVLTDALERYLPGAAIRAAEVENETWL